MDNHWFIVAPINDTTHHRLSLLFSPPDTANAASHHRSYNTPQLLIRTILPAQHSSQDDSQLATSTSTNEFGAVLLATTYQCQIETNGYQHSRYLPPPKSSQCQFTLLPDTDTAWNVVTAGGERSIEGSQVVVIEAEDIVERLCGLGPRCGRCTYVVHTSAADVRLAAPHNRVNRRGG